MWKLRCMQILTLLTIGSTSAFSPSGTTNSRMNNMGGLMMMTDNNNSNNVNHESRRTFFDKIVGATTLASLTLVQGPNPVYALGGKANKVNAQLQGYGLPTIDKIPDGLTPLLEIWGKGKNRDPLLVQFCHPFDWVVTLPSQDVNGEDGTIQAGEYAKGDTATFFVYSDTGKVDDIDKQSKEFFQQAIVKAISQKGDNIYQNFKIINVAPKTENGQNYAIVDFKYELLTGAGFEVDRRGVASVTSAGNATELLWCASTRQRFKKTEPALRAIADSFRVYADGLDLQKIVYEE